MTDRSDEHRRRQANAERLAEAMNVKLVSKETPSLRLWSSSNTRREGSAQTPKEIPEVAGADHH